MRGAQAGATRAAAQLDEWYAAEEAAKSAAAANGLECTVLRTGDLIGGPFYDTTGDLQVWLRSPLES